MYFAKQNTPAVVGEAPAQGIKMEVGIEDCLHIEFEFDKQKYHLQVQLRVHYFEFILLFNLAHFIATGRDFGQDLLFTGAYQDQIYGACRYSQRSCWYNL